ncbi:MAG: TonB family protein [Polyangiaceae bacterium]|nr:TonB family protein [Polyangiaceae bacterium]
MTRAWPAHRALCLAELRRRHHPRLVTLVAALALGGCGAGVSQRAEATPPVLVEVAPPTDESTEQPPDEALELDDSGDAPGEGIPAVSASEESYDSGPAGPSPTSGPIAASGFLDPSLIQQVIRQALPLIKSCYERQLVLTPTLRARLAAEFVIDTSGNVTSASVRTGSAEPSFDRCVVAIIQRLKFPAPKGGTVKVAYPFVFAPG